MAGKKHPGGRPSSYKPEYCQALIDHMSQGLSFDTFGATIGVSRDVIYKWCNVHEEFFQAKKIAMDKCQLWWEQEGIRSLGFKFYQSAIWIMNMKARFGWSDKVEVQVSGDEEKPVMLKYSV